MYWSHSSTFFVIFYSVSGSGNPLYYCFSPVLIHSSDFSNWLLFFYQHKPIVSCLSNDFDKPSKYDHPHNQIQ
ncbi:hypothetical protein GDO78_006822 [Eleutherodactylus coqui]|uniref:Uncharacterized protein n=1 Tax=Eleutherodactylus coqui TaxID=57060 RepID=A0A8J6FFZ3_ELECQ|nr:hypothetical protein GDO78_006822 [Eleutherodactylus coqui]